MESEMVPATKAETEKWTLSQRSLLHFFASLWLKHHSLMRGAHRRLAVKFHFSLSLARASLPNPTHLTRFLSSVWFIWFVGDGNKSSPLNTNWTSPKQPTNDKRKPLDDSYAGVSWPFLHSHNFPLIARFDEATQSTRKINQFQH